MSLLTSAGSVKSAPLPPALLENILLKLGFSERPDVSHEALAGIYAAWSHKVPFDNVRKLIHVRGENPGAFPGSNAEDFFNAWLKHGTGGTCWAGSGAMWALLSSLGFDTKRAMGTMLVAPDVPPNHGTVVVTLDGRNYLMDTAMICVEPLLLDEENETRVSHPAWGLTCSRKDGRWYIAWRPLHKTEEFECRIEHFSAEDQDFQTMHESTRAWSPFNYELTARVNKDEGVVGAAFGHAITFEKDGSVTRAPITMEERNRLLIEKVGLSEEIVSSLPADKPTPPPPGSQTAELANAKAN